MFVRSLTAADQPWKLATLDAGWGSSVVARLGELVDAAPLAGFVAIDDDQPLGLLTYTEHGNGIEVVTIQAQVEGRGIGRGLMDAVHDHATARAASRIWLITTNDNVRAFAFYQRWGMDLRRVVRDGVDISRRIKPTIPLIGGSGIPIRHELEFERLVDR